MSSHKKILDNPPKVRDNYLKSNFVLFTCRKIQNAFVLNVVVYHYQNLNSKLFFTSLNYTVFPTLSDIIQILLEISSEF